jgi:hypothetical protein
MLIAGPGPRPPLRPGRPGRPRLIPLLYGFQVVWRRPYCPLPLTRYRLYRRDDVSAPVLVAELTPEVHDYWDFTTRPGTRYAYSVAAANPLGEGARSDEAVGVLPTSR